MGMFSLVAIAWGGSFVAIKSGLDGGMPPVLYAALRFDLGAILLLAAAAYVGGNLLPRTRDDWLSIVASGVFVVALNNGLLFVGQQYTTSGIASIIYSLNPILSAGFGWALLPETSLSKTDLVGIALGFVGVAVVAHPTGSLGQKILGIGIVFTAATCIASGSVLSRRVDESISTFAGTGWAMALGAVLLHATSFLLGESMHGVQFGPGIWLDLAYLAVVATAIAYAAYFTLLGSIGPVRTNLVSYAVPIVAALAGWELRGSPISGLTLAGFAVIVIGFGVLNWDVVSKQVGTLSMG